ncbi:MAG TPA: PQQ-binding-like beta-propeller repeat protein [Pyrinomonadaceae bacterium]|nr:PQQ-binding-like beta-propeller repeat protein [Pyrinomonadaceae bacterium]
MSHLLTHKSLDRSAPAGVFAILISMVMFVVAPVAALGSDYQEPEVFSKCWESPVSSNLAVAPAADASAVYFLDDDNKLHGLDLATGTSVWSSEVGGVVISNLLVVDDLIFLVTSAQSEAPGSSPKTIVRALSRQTGITVWQTVTRSTGALWLGGVAGNVVAAGSDGSMSAFTRVDGKVVWQIDLSSGVISEPHFHESGIELGTENREVVSISGATGELRVAMKSEFPPTAVITDPSGRLIVGDERGNVMSVSPDGNKVWSFRNGAQISSARLYASEYLIASHDNFVYKLSRGGNVKWKRRLSGRAADKPLILGHTAVVSVVGTGSIYALDLKNGKILNRIETGDEVSLRLAGTADALGFVVAGPRGLLYFSGKCPAK